MDYNIDSEYVASEIVDYIIRVGKIKHGAGTGVSFRERGSLYKKCVGIAYNNLYKFGDVNWYHGKFGWLMKLRDSEVASIKKRIGEVIRDGNNAKLLVDYYKDEEEVADSMGDEKKVKRLVSGKSINKPIRVMNDIKNLAGALKRYYFTITLSERHTKFLAYESARSNIPVSSIVRMVLDRYIDARCREDERLASLLDSIVDSSIIDDAVRTAITKADNRRKGKKVEVTTSVFSVCDVEDDSIVPDDHGDDYIMSVAGKINNDNG